MVQFGKNIFGYEHKEYTTPIERFINISSWALDIIHKHKQEQQKFILKVTRLAQKVKLYFKLLRTVVFLNIDYNSPTYIYDTVVPSVVKKDASGKGNADKQFMYDAFKELQRQI